MRRSHFPFFALGFATLFGALASPAQAGDLLLQIDNDKIVDTDRHYTNGMRIAYTPTSDADFGNQFRETTQFMAEAMQFKSVEDLRTGWVAGQEMYTPENVDIYVPNPKDRPYAGWTYLGLTAQSTDIKDISAAQALNTGYDRQDTFELDVGMIGPNSKAAQLQNAVHRVINVSVSRGWRSQIHNELGILATRIIKLRTRQHPLFDTNWLQSDAIFHTTAHLGNVKTALAMGGTFRLGGNLREDFGPVYGTFALPHKAPKDRTWSAFAGFEARGVARDIFLDGNSFRNSLDVKKNPFVFETRLGLTSHFPVKPVWGVKALRLSLNMVQRTREFKTQDKADRYGSLQITVNF